MEVSGRHWRSLHTPRSEAQLQGLSSVGWDSVSGVHSILRPTPAVWTQSSLPGTDGVLSAQVRGREG